MKNEIVKYHNDLNTVPMRNWNREEMDFFFSILSELRDKGTKEIILDKSMLKDIANSSIKHNKRFEEAIENLIKNVAQIHYIERTSNSLELMNLFSKFKAKWEEDYSDMQMYIKVTEEFSYVLNKLDFEFTSWQLEEFTSIKSTYAKTMYRLLKQWKKKGYRKFSVEEFRTLLDVPETYTSNNIHQRVITPIEKELPKYFENFKAKPIKKKTRGTPIIEYEFTWAPQQSSTQKWIKDKYNKKSKAKNYDGPPPGSLAASDNRMTREEREEFVRNKMNQRLPINKKQQAGSVEEIENVEGQMDLTDL